MRFYSPLEWEGEEREGDRVGTGSRGSTLHESSFGV